MNILDILTVVTMGVVLIVLIGMAVKNRNPKPSDYRLREKELWERKG